VVVTIQFRLGAFGFLALDTKDVPGNAGLKDQNMALKWIKRNIKNFGGDPYRITLAGLSSGAHSTTAHMISPMSEGLFQNVIAASGALPWQKKLRRNNIQLAQELAGRVNCNNQNIEAMTQCLTFVSAKKHNS
jgi:acetylcholinesterase